MSRYRCNGCRQLCETNACPRRCHPSHMVDASAPPHTGDGEYRYKHWNILQVCADLNSSTTGAADSWSDARLSDTIAWLEWRLKNWIGPTGSFDGRVRDLVNATIDVGLTYSANQRPDRRGDSLFNAPLHKSEAVIAIGGFFAIVDTANGQTIRIANTPSALMGWSLRERREVPGCPFAIASSLADGETWSPGGFELRRNR